MSSNLNENNNKNNLRQNFYHQNFTQLKNYYISLNLGKNNNRNSNNITTNTTTTYKSEDKDINLKKNLTFYSQEERPHLTNDDKKKLKIIIKNFNKNKVVTEELFNQEKKLRLNSINKTNYFFLINNEKQYKERNKKRKNAIYKMNKTDYSCTTMIDKFNNKTFGILDTTTTNKIFSKNLTNFTKQIINNFSDKIKTGKDLEYSKMKNKYAMNILDQIDKLYIKKALETEKKFYEAKYNGLKDESGKNIGRMKDEIFITNKPINQERTRKKEKTHIFKNGKILSKLDFDLINNSNSKSHRNSVIFIKNNRNDSGIKNKNKTTSNIISDKNIEIFNNSNNINNNSSSYLKSNNNSNNCKYKKITNNETFIKEFHKISNKNRMKKIIEHSKNFADSFLELDYMPYKPMNNLKVKINHYNLERAIRIKNIYKNKKDKPEAEFIIQDPNKIRDELLNMHMQFYKANYNKDYNFHFLKKKFKSQTIRKFAYIKDSYFGVPC